jgi:hypothetical protein
MHVATSDAVGPPNADASQSTAPIGSLASSSTLGPKIWQSDELPSLSSLRPPSDLFDGAATIPAIFADRMLRSPGQRSFCMMIGRLCGGDDEKVQDAWRKFAALPAVHMDAIARSFVDNYLAELTPQQQASAIHYVRLLLSKAGIERLRELTRELRGLSGELTDDGLAVEPCWAWCARHIPRAPGFDDRSRMSPRTPLHRDVYGERVEEEHTPVWCVKRLLQQIVNGMVASEWIDASESLQECIVCWARYDATPEAHELWYSLHPCARLRPRIHPSARPTGTAPAPRAPDPLEPLVAARDGARIRLFPSRPRRHAHGGSPRAGMHWLCATCMEESLQTQVDRAMRVEQASATPDSLGDSWWNQAVLRVKPPCPMCRHAVRKTLKHETAGLPC